MGYTPGYFNGILLQQTLLIFMNHFLTQIAYLYQLCEINIINSNKINSLDKDLQVKIHLSHLVTTDAIKTEIFLLEQKL